MRIRTKIRLSDRILFYIVRRMNLILVISSALLAGYITISLSDTIWTENNDEYIDESNAIVISGPAGTWRINGINNIMNPLLREANRMNNIESWENHMQGDPRTSPREYDF